ncbi:MAG: TMEM165/GDT1 family protein [Chloroflexota bacterium]|nr:TMEM165/GDT1 family protein [Chloroflexota bacterium]
MDWRVFAATFAALFVAELGDKTQLAVITLTSKHQSPWSVFLGASAALCLVTLIGVVFGQAVTAVIPADLLRKIASGLFVLLGVLMWFEIL